MADEWEDGLDNTSPAMSREDWIRAMLRRLLLGEGIPTVAWTQEGWQPGDDEALREWMEGS